MTAIFFTRHGETQWNVLRKMQGWQDSPLTEKGRLQAVQLRERMKTTPLTTVYSSDAPRAVTTAELICGNRDIPIVPMEGLREMGLGDWEGCSINELLKKGNESSQNFFYHPQKFVPPKGAESFNDVRSRIAKTLSGLAKKHENESILIVAHGILMRNISAYLRKKSIEEVWSDLYKPTALSLVIANNNDFEIEYWNDTSHYS